MPNLSEQGKFPRDNHRCLVVILHAGGDSSPFVIAV